MDNQVATSVLARVLPFLALTIALISPLPAARGAPPPQFGPQTTFLITNSPCSLLVADLNHDRSLDLVVVRSGGISALLGRGDGTFTITNETSVSGSPHYAAAGDFNNDQQLDLLTIGDYDGPLLLGDGSGNFPTRSNSVISYYSDGMAVADFNGDGKLDYITSSGFRRLTLYLGLGDASFKPFTNYTLTGDTSDLRAADLDGNGQPDLVVSLRTSASTGTNVCVMLSQGGGIFAPPQYYVGAASTAVYKRSLELADLNGDGSPDMALLSYDARLVTIRLNNGDGTLGSPTDYPVSFYPHSFAAADFNGDENTDLFVRGDSQAVFLVGRGDGSFTIGPPVWVPSDSYWHSTVAAGDFNGDGRPDLALLNYSGKAVVVILNRTPPYLHIARRLGYHQISWLATFGVGFTLEYTTNLARHGVWQPFPYPPVVIGNQVAVTDWEDREGRFYRLRKP